MPATPAIDLRANVNLWGSKGEHKQLPGHRPERPEARLWRPGRRQGRPSREVGAQQHAGAACWESQGMGRSRHGAACLRSTRLLGSHADDLIRVVDNDLRVEQNHKTSHLNNGIVQLNMWMPRRSIAS